MTQVISINTKTADAILSSLRRLENAISRLNEKLEKAPSYGSREWWNESDKKALKSIKEGNGIIINTKKELNAFFKSL